MCRRECGMIAHVKDGRIAAVYGDPEDPINRGTLCAKGAAAVEFEYDDKRVITPLIRIEERGEGKWRKATWDEAIDYAAKKLSEIKSKYGAEAIGLISGCEAEPNSFFLDRRFMDAIGSPSYCNGWGLCYAPNMFAEIYTFGMPTYDWLESFDFYKHSKLIIIWGTGIWEGGMPIPDAVFTTGAKLIVIDPLLTPIASRADIWVSIKPNTDLAMALAMINVIVNENLYDKDFVEKYTVGFDKLREHVQKNTPEWAEKITDVPAETIRNVARMYATTKPAYVKPNACCHHSQYFQRVRAMWILQAITGNVDVYGGKLFMRNRTPEMDDGTLICDVRLGLRDIRPKTELGKEFPAVYALLKHLQYFTMIDNSWQKELREGRIKAVIADAVNMVIRKPNSQRALDVIKNLELLVVFDVYMNETAKYADVVLPSTTFLERDGFSLSSYNKEGVITVRQKVVEPPGECKSNFELFTDLARKMGLGEYFQWKNVKELIDYILEPTGVSFEMLKKEGIVRVGEPMKEKLYQEQGFPTPSKKVELHSSMLEFMGVDPLPTWHDELRPQPTQELPLILSSYTPLRQHSWTPWLWKLEEALEFDVAYLHRDMAEKIGVHDGSWVVVETKHGNAKFKAKVTEFIHPKSVIVSRGLHQQAKLIDILDPIDSVTGFMAERGMACNLRGGV